MFNINSFYRKDALKLHYLCFFLRKKLLKNRKTCFMSRVLNEIKCKTTSKTTKKLKSLS